MDTENHLPGVDQLEASLSGPDEASLDRARKRPRGSESHPLRHLLPRRIVHGGIEAPAEAPSMGIYVVTHYTLGRYAALASV